MQTYRNPVIPGFYPDPSVVRVGEDYYLVTSSFEYFPGVPIFHSKNLVQWEQIGYVLTRKEQLDLTKRRSSHGIFAPTIRYHDGLFYLVTTDVNGIGNFYVTARDPRGPWSEPIQLPYGGIDPSLMFDDDGRVYVTVQQGAGKDSHIIQYEIDPRTGAAWNEPRRIWDGDGGVWTEAPHLYKINGMYYIMSACGGTSYDHREIIGRSTDPYGPFEPCPYPILTHNKRPEHPLQCLGHADLVDDTNGQWWAVFLGTRPTPERYAVLGRETFLAPVTWNEEGWPMIDNNEGTVQEQMTVAQLPAPLLDKPPSPQHWSFLKTFDEDRYILGNGDTVSDDSMVLIGNAHSLEDDGPATFACIRQTDHRMRFSCKIEYKPQQNGEEAGIAARLNHRGHVILSIKQMEGTRFVHVTVRNGEHQLESKIAWEQDTAYFALESDEGAYYCSYSADGVAWQTIPLNIKAEWLSADRNGGFTGVCVGLYASGNGLDRTTAAAFEDIKYEALSS